MSKKKERTTVPTPSSFPVRTPYVPTEEPKAEPIFDSYECPICDSTWSKSESSKCKVCEEQGRISVGIPFKKP